MTKADKIFAFKIIMIPVIALLVMHFVTVTANPDVEEWTTHAVAPGETLWSIAKEYNPEAENVDAVIYAMKRRNCMKTSVIYVGDVIDVPVMGR